MSQSSPIHPVIIIGSGPAGYTSAIYTARAGLAPIVLAGSVSAGGALMTTTEVENYPGFPDGIMGPDLMEAMSTQAAKFGADIRYEDVTEVKLTGPIKTIITDEGAYQAHSVIVATGSAYRELGLESERRLAGRGVSYCATCDGFFFRDKPIIVIGGGDSAVEEATFLSRFGSSVTLVHRRDQLRASKAMVDRALADPKISIAWNCVVADIVGDNQVEAVVLRDTQSGQERTIAAAGVFVAIGHLPRTDLVKGQLDLDQSNYIKVADPGTSTSLPGVFACGDVVDHTYRQAITAAGMGCRAALDAEHYLAAL